jgi:hypothetical protein
MVVRIDQLDQLDQLSSSLKRISPPLALAKEMNASPFSIHFRRFIF